MSEEERFALVDGHVHLWDLSHPWYPAMQDPEMAKAYASIGDVTRMARDFLLPEYRAETAGYEIMGVVHVSATTAPRAYLEEATWLDGILGDAGVPAVTIGTVDPGLSPAELEADLDAQARSARFRGARVLHGLEPASPTAADLCRLLGERGWIFELVSHPGDAVAFRRLVERFPELDVVLEHAGWPDGTSSEQFDSWRAGMMSLAELPNVSCKVSGLGMVTHTLEEASLRPWIDACLEIFGVDRCMFGGNFPVEAMYGRFDELMTSFRSATERLSDEERRAFFVENARRVYRV